MTPYNSQDLRNDAIRHTMFMRTPKEDLNDFAPYILAYSDGVTVTDVNGCEYIDAIASGGRATLVGYGREEIAKALYDQAKRLHCHASHHTISDTAIKLVKKLADIAPGELTSTTLLSGGSDANESAFKLAKQYHMHKGNPRRYKIISRRGAFHGTTLGALSATGSMSPMREINAPLVPGFYFIPSPSCYRCPFGKEYPNCELDCANALEKQIQFEDPEQVAAFIAEPIMQFGGVNLPPPEYFPKVRSICDEYGVLLIDDEVITGFGRTGKWFACEHYNFVPDLMTLAKGITSGYIPLAAVMMTTKIADTLPIFMDIRTYTLHPVASAGALANINIIEKENLLKNALNNGSYLIEGLKSLMKHPMVGDIRGIGMWGAIELVQDKKAKSRFTMDRNPAELVAKIAREKGVLIGVVDQSVEVAPPLIISKIDIDTVIEVLDQSLASIEKELGIN